MPTGNQAEFCLSASMLLAKHDTVILKLSSSLQYLLPDPLAVSGS